MKTKSFATASGAVLALGTAFLALSPDANAQIVKVVSYGIAAVPAGAASAAVAGKQGIATLCP